ncbi:MAG TPA: hypothetical protein VMD75_13250 [Candidatus Binataceae bacterium]|nr:hypothetical protein [Candidatus Binataceae bacterium]
MKLSHLAALGLAGWYLMVPPIQNGQLNLRAPLNQWRIDSSYDGQDDCQEVIDGEAALYPQTKEHHAAIRKSDVWPIVNGQCVATDDPRLKTN